MNPTNGALSWLLVGSWLFCLHGCGESAIRQLAAQLGDADARVRRYAASGLANIRGSSSDLIAALTLASSSDDVEVREIAVEALGKKAVESDQLFPALEKALDDPELAVRLKAALASYRFDPQNESYRPILLESLRAGHGTVFLEVGRMGAKASWAVPTLVAALSDGRPSIRALAARTLGEVGPSDGDAERALRRVLADQSSAVRNAALEALQKLSENAATGPTGQRRASTDL